MARVEVVMPQMGESIVEGTIVQWLKNLGDAVEKDDDIFTLSTDKVDAEVPSPEAGILIEIRAAVGDTVEVGTTVAVVETDASAVKAAPASPPNQEPAPPPAALPAAPSPTARAAQPPAPATPSPTAHAAQPPALAASAGDRSAEELRLQRSTPLVRKIAAEHGIDDLSVISGTGHGGRVTKKDIIAFIEAGGALPPAAAPPLSAPEAAAPPLSVPEAAAPPLSAPEAAAPPLSAPEAATPRSPAPPAPAAGSVQPFVVKQPRVHIYEGDRVEPMSRMRASIADNMLQARRSTAHCHTVWEADVSAVVRARESLKADFEGRGVKLTYTAFFVAAVVDGLRNFPLLNAAIDGQNIVYRGNVNIGVAAAVDDGLIVPVLKNADTLNLFGIAKGINDLSLRARTRKLMPQDVSDGTFSVSNSGIWGSLFGVPILIPPQVGILSVGGVEKRVVADDDENIRVRSMVYLCLTFDHRLIDGATADGFMSHVTRALARWEI